MQHVLKGQKIKSSTINELIDKAQASTFNGTSINSSRWPTPFIVQARSSYDTSLSSDVLSAIAVYNNFLQLDGKLYEAEDCTLTSNINSISTIWSGISDGQLSVFTNNDELSNFSPRWRLYDVSASTSADTFIVKRDYRQSIASTPAPLYGVFRWEGNTGHTEGTSPEPTGTVTHCNFLFGRTPIHLDDIDGVEDGEWWLEVDHDDPSSATLADTNTGNTPDKTFIPIFTISNQEVTEDWRGAVTVPVWEPTSSGGNSGGGTT